MEQLYRIFFDTGNAIVTTWIMVFILRGVLAGLARTVSYVRHNKIQSRKIRGSLLRHELSWSAFNLACTAMVLTFVSSQLVEYGFIETNPEPAAWYVILFEFALFFFIFDLYFYVVHRLLHVQPLYRWFHKTHHVSIQPNPLSSSSMTPVEGISEGMIIPIFLAVFTIHEQSSYVILPFATLMGLYVHSGYDFMPKWWYQRWYSKWMQSPIFHDQHHQYFSCNYGGFTTIWDRVFKTLRPRMEQDFVVLKSRQAQNRVSNPSPAVQPASGKAASQ